MIKKIIFLGFLSLPTISLANFFNASDFNTNNMIGGCTQGSLGPAYSSSICNNDGTYKDDVKHVVHHHIWHLPAVGKISSHVPPMMIRNPMGR